MSIFLSLSIEIIYHNADMAERTNMVRTASRASDGDASLNFEQDYTEFAIWKKVLLIFLAVSFSFLIGTTRFILGAHSLDQVIFGWLLGAWIALSYLYILRQYVHEHVQNLMNGKTGSRSMVYYLAAGGFWLLMSLTLFFTLLIVKEKEIG